MKIITYLFILSLVVFCSCNTKNKPKQDSSFKVKEQVIEENIKDYELKEFKDYHFALSYPANWIVNNEQKGALFICKMNCDSSNVFCSNFVVNVVPLKSKITIEDIAKVFLKNISGQFEKYQIINEETDTINGLQCVIVDYKMFENNTHLGGTTAFFQIEKNIVSVNCMGENQEEGEYLHYRKIFYKVFNSFVKI
jgi:hypothetical protein